MKFYQYFKYIKLYIYIYIYVCMYIVNLDFTFVLYAYIATLIYVTNLFMNNFENIYRLSLLENLLQYRLGSK